MYFHKIIKGAFLLLLKENQILLYKRKDTAHFQGYYGIISGNVEENEIYEAAIIREANEEIGVKINPKDLKAIHVMHRIDEQDESIYVFFILKKWQGEIENIEPNKCEQLIWKSIDELPPNIVPYIKDAIDNYKKKIFFSEYRWQ